MKENLASQIEALKLRSQKYPSVRQGAREFRKGHYGKRIIFHHSLKSGGVLLPCEGDLEYRNCLMMEFDSSVESYWLQPFKIDLGQCKYIPDVYIQYRSGIEAFREVKPSGRLESPDVNSLLYRAKGFFLEYGYSFEVVTEKNLWNENELANLSYIYSCLSPVPSASAISVALEIFFNFPKPALVGDFRSFIEENNINPNLIEYLIFSGDITIEHNTIFSEKTLLRGK